MVKHMKLKNVIIKYLLVCLMVDDCKLLYHNKNTRQPMGILSATLIHIYNVI